MQYRGTIHWIGGETPELARPLEATLDAVNGVLSLDCDRGGREYRGFTLRRRVDCDDLGAETESWSGTYADPAVAVTAKVAHDGQKLTWRGHWSEDRVYALRIEIHPMPDGQ